MRVPIFLGGGIVLIIAQPIGGESHAVIIDHCVDVTRNNDEMGIPSENILQTKSLFKIECKSRWNNYREGFVL